MTGIEKELLKFIPDARDWIGSSAAVKKNGYGVAEEEKKLELRLGPPGVEDFGVDSSKCANIGAKRGFLVSTESKTEALRQQQPQCGFVQQQGLERKKMCGFEAAVGANKSLQTSDSANHTAPVVGWPPVRPSFRKNIASSSKTSIGSQKESSEPPTKPEETKKNLLIKINMDGTPIGRKVDLKAYNSYNQLSLAVAELFRGLLAAQAGHPATGAQKAEQKHNIAGFLDGSDDYTLVYEDDEGDRMLVGDVPWNMFVSTAKRLRVLKSSELCTSTLGTVSRKPTANKF